MNDDILKMLRSLMQHASLEEREAYDRFLESCLEAALLHIPKDEDGNQFFLDNIAIKQGQR